MTALRVEVRVPVSPTVEFAWMLSVLHRSLVRHGGLNDVRLTAMIGAPAKDAEASQTMAAWLAPQMNAVIIDPTVFERDGVHATARRRLTEPSAADVVVLMDADLVVCGPLVDVCAEAREDGAVAGVVAHTPPFLTAEDWTRAYATAGVGTPTFPYRYTGWPYMWPRSMRRRPGCDRAPPYYNYGFVVMSAPALADLATNHDARVLEAAVTPPRAARARLANRRRRGMFRSQIALTLAIERAGIPHRALGMRYNFPNDHRLEALHPAELDDARTIHLHRRNQGVDKRDVYRSIDGLRRLVAAGWRTAGATEIARRVIADLLPELEDVEPPAQLGRTRWIW